MKYLNKWNDRIKNLNNTGDYRKELQKVKSIQGPNFKFDYTDYVIKILLATFIRHFNLDQQKLQRQQPDYYSDDDDDCFCVIS